ncbi:hypothetical protein GCM10027605_13560 [Micromonospora zhanjiangensis]
MGEPGVDDLPGAQEGGVHLDDQLRGGRYGQQRQGVVHLFPDRQPRAGRSTRATLCRDEPGTSTESSDLQRRDGLVPAAFHRAQLVPQPVAARPVTGQYGVPHRSSQGRDVAFELFRGVPHPSKRTSTGDLQQ